MEYFRYSLNPNNKFIGQECHNYTEWLEGKCAKNRSDNFGIYARYLLYIIFISVNNVYVVKA